MTLFMKIFHCWKFQVFIDVLYSFVVLHSLFGETCMWGWWHERNIYFKMTFFSRTAYSIFLQVAKEVLDFLLIKANGCKSIFWVSERKYWSSFHLSNIELWIFEVELHKLNTGWWQTETKYNKKYIKKLLGYVTVFGFPLTTVYPSSFVNIFGDVCISFILIYIYCSIILVDHWLDGSTLVLDTFGLWYHVLAIIS